MPSVICAGIDPEKTQILCHNTVGLLLLSLGVPARPGSGRPGAKFFLFTLPAGAYENLKVNLKYETSDSALTK
jgi:hypothetical protein